MEYLTTEIYVYGVTVTKVDNKLETDFYCQPNDTHQHLHAQSCDCNTVMCIKDLLHKDSS